MCKPLLISLHKIACLSSQVANLCANLSLSCITRKNKNLDSSGLDSNPSNSPKILVMSLGRAGGLSQYAFKLLEHFSLPYTLYQTKYAIAQEWQEKAIHITTYRHNRLSFAINTLCILPLHFVRIFWHSRHYDVLFLPYFHFWNLAFILAFKLRGKRVVIVEHDGIVHIGEEYPLQQTLTNLSLKYADEIIFLSHFVKNRINPALIAHKKTYIVPHGLYDFKGLQRVPKTYTKSPNILFFGRINPYKGIELLIEALRTIPTHLYDTFIIAGKSSIHYDVSHFKTNKVRILDRFLTQEEIAKVFNQSHILVMPYIEASQSGVACTAIANCIPTICTDVGGLQEQFRLDSNNALCALICEPNAQSIAQSLQKLLSDKVLYENLTHNLMLRAQELEWSNIAKAVQEILMSGGGALAVKILLYRESHAIYNLQKYWQIQNNISKNPQPILASQRWHYAA